MTNPTFRATDASDRTLDDPTETQVHDLFADLNQRWPFAIVERRDREPVDQHYFQIHLVYLNPDDDTDHEPEIDYDVEFRAGGPTRHYCTRISDGGFSGLEKVMAAYKAWREDDPGLMTMFEWELASF